jgi:[calcium/calmodulin-dependent protein kinase] kinase
VHRNHVVHRDIKPANLLLGCDGRLRIADFGVSCEFHGAEDIVLETAAGTPAFHAPEALAGSGQFHGKAADVWAMGVTLYFLVYGALPFSDTNILALQKLIQHQELKFPDELHTSTSAQLRDLLKHMLDKDPSRRITVSEMKEHSWVTCDGTWLFQEEENSCNIDCFDNIVIDESPLYPPVFSIPSIPYFSSLTHLMKTMFLKHSFHLPSFKFS